MIFLDDITEWAPTMQRVFEGTRKVRVHRDVMALAYTLAVDADKLQGASRFIFMPSDKTWVEWEDNQGKMGFFFDGHNGSVGQGFGFWGNMRHGDEPVIVPCSIDTPAYSLTFDPETQRERMLENANGNKRYEASIEETFAKMTLESRLRIEQGMVALKPVVWAILALINSPKIIRQHEIDQSKLNKRRTAQGRYTFHPHHEVRLNVDKHVIDTVAGSGDGCSRALHFVRAHLRFRLGQYELVRPHWRGDPALGIRDTHYAVDRQNSRWAE
jgi:hypothetical protein